MFLTIMRPQPTFITGRDIIELMIGWALGALVLILYGLHQDIWLWHSATPIVFGVLPIGLAYHVAYSIAIAGVMWLLVRYAWPEGER
jgi:hypothetical protein